MPSAIRSGLAALIVLLLALAVASSAFAWGSEVRLSPIGPSPSTVTIKAGESIVFWKPGDQADSEISFDSVSCSPFDSIVPELSPCAVTISGVGGCTEPANCFVGRAIRIWDVGLFSYHVTGFSSGDGKVVVEPSGLIEAARTVVTYGERARLRGTLTPGRDGGPPWTAPFPEYGITLVARPFSSEELKPIAGTVTRNGFWELRARPRIETTYRSYFLDSTGISVARSEDIVVRVRPKVNLRAVGRNTYLTRAKALLSFQGKPAIVQRWDGHFWRGALALSLGRHSSARFHLRGVPPGSRIRIFVPPSQPGYIAGLSRILTIPTG